MPLLCEKIVEPPVDSQVDCIETMLKLLTRLKESKNESLSKYAKQSGEVLVDVILAGRDDNAVAACVDAVSRVAHALSANDLAIDAAPTGALSTYTDALLTPTLAAMTGAATLPRVRTDAGRALAALCRGAAASCLVTLRKALAPLLARHSTSNEGERATPTQRSADVMLTAALVAASVQCAQVCSFPMYPLVPYRDAVHTLLIESARDDESASARAAAIEGLWLLLNAMIDSDKRLCSDDQISQAVLQIPEWLVDNNTRVRDAALRGVCRALSDDAAPSAYAHSRHCAHGRQAGADVVATLRHSAAPTIAHSLSTTRCGTGGRRAGACCTTHVWRADGAGGC